ncbi:hypothetical protein T12_45 [Trichinella patagoniensis]|uniref:Uncharacterized protein n=1 Tax=Trichinella patagoniensis TaxID=990121 RepID=A0A0V0ZQW8_9BILA|nr:hypothetical protein T12_45 [Trichinella patagoniensis]
MTLNASKQFGNLILIALVAKHASGAFIYIHIPAHCDIEKRWQAVFCKLEIIIY